MTAKDNPFVTITAKCPICDHSASHRYLKSKLYSSEEIEGDLHVTKYKWERPDFEYIRPNFYHIWHCPHCHFCDEKEVFRGEDKSGGKLELIQEKILIQQRNPNSYLAKTGDEIDVTSDNLGLNVALLAHLQAIYMQEMLSPNMRQFGKLGRFYLRTAWLYRERETLAELNMGDLPFGFATIESFITQPGMDWENPPLDEKSAIEKSIEYYQKDLDRSTAGFEDIRHEVGVIFVLVDLELRLNKVDDAMKYVRHIFQSCTRKRQETRNAIEKGGSKGKLNARQIEQMRNLVKWLNNTIERCTALSDKVNGVIFEDEYPGARELVLKMSNPDANMILLALREANFHEITCRRVATMFNKLMKEKQAKLNPETADETKEEPKKGGFWGKIVTSIKGDEDEEKTE